MNPQFGSQQNSLGMKTANEKYFNNQPNNSLIIANEINFKIHCRPVPNYARSQSA